MAVIGDARLESPELIKYAVDVGHVIATAGYHLVCGGLGGVMLDACRGFKQANNDSIKTIGILPGHQAAAANEFIDIVIPTGLDVGRNQLVVASGFAAVVFGGGAGTLSEIALASQLGKPIILLKGSGGWADQLTMDYLDKRQNARLYPVHQLSELAPLLLHLENNTSNDKTSNNTSNNKTSGAINSGHNR